MTIWLNKSRKIFRQLVDYAIMRNVFFDPPCNKWPRAKPGEVIQKLPPEKRKELESLKSDDIKNDFFPL